MQDGGLNNVITRFSTNMHDSNKIATTMHKTSSVSENTEGHVGSMSDVWVFIKPQNGGH